MATPKGIYLPSMGSGTRIAEFNGESWIAAESTGRLIRRLTREEMAEYEIMKRKLNEQTKSTQPGANPPKT